MPGSSQKRLATGSSHSGSNMKPSVADRMPETRPRAASVRAGRSPMVATLTEAMAYLSCMRGGSMGSK